MTDGVGPTALGGWARPEAPSGTLGDPDDLDPVDPNGHGSAGGYSARNLGRLPSAPADAAAAAARARRRRQRPLRLPVPLRPMTITDIVDGCYAVLRARPRMVGTIAVVLLVPPQLLGMAATRSPAAGINPLAALFVTSEDEWSLLGSGVAWALSSFSLAAMAVALGRVLSVWYSGGELTAGEALGHLWRRAGVLSAAWLIVLPARLLGAALCGVGALLVAPLLVALGPVIGMEDGGVRASIGRATSLVRPRLGQVLLIVVFVTVTEWVAQAALVALPWMVADAALPSSAVVGVVAACSAAARVVTGTAVASAAVLVAIDLRVRSEGLDLELDAARVAPRPS